MMNDATMLFDDLTLAAFRAVADHFDSGVAFEARCRSSSTFAQAVERARFLRAFSPSELRRLARRYYVATNEAHMSGSKEKPVLNENDQKEHDQKIAQAAPKK